MSGSGVEFFSKFRQCFFSILIVSPLGKGPRHLNKLELPLPKEDFLPSLDYIWRSGSWENVFKFLKCTFAISLLSPFGKGQCPIFEETWISFTQCKEDLCQFFVEISTVALEKTIFKCQFLFPILLLCPLGEGLGLSFEQTWIPFIKGWFVPSLVENGHMVQDEIFKFRQCIYPISLLFPLRKKYDPSFTQTLIPFTQVWLKLPQWFWRRRFF